MSDTDTGEVERVGCFVPSEYKHLRWHIIRPNFEATGFLEIAEWANDERNGPPEGGHWLRWGYCGDFPSLCQAEYVGPVSPLYSGSQAPEKANQVVGNFGEVERVAKAISKAYANANAADNMLAMGLEFWPYIARAAIAAMNETRNFADEADVAYAYTDLLKMDHGRPRVLAQRAMCVLRDLIAKHTGHTSEEVQNSYEQQAKLNHDHANGLPVETPEIVTPPDGQVFYTDGSPSRELLDAAMNEGRGEKKSSYSSYLAIATENAELREALTEIIEATTDSLEAPSESFSAGMAEVQFDQAIVRARALLSSTKGEK